MILRLLSALWHGEEIAWGRLCGSGSPALLRRIDEVLLLPGGGPDEPRVLLSLGSGGWALDRINSQIAEDLGSFGGLDALGAFNTGNQRSWALSDGDD